jgi:hypothetical protein
LAERAVWPMAVVVVLVLVEHGGGVPLVDEQSAVEEFVSDEAFGYRVGPRRPYRCLDDADVSGGEDSVEGCGELGVAVPDEELEATADVVEVHEQVASLLGQPGAGWMRSDAEDVHSPGSVLNDEERVQPAQGDGVEVKEVAGQDGVRLARRNSVQDGPARLVDGSIPALCRIFETVEAPIR